MRRSDAPAPIDTLSKHCRQPVFPIDPLLIINNAESFSFSSKSATERRAFDEKLVPFDSPLKGVRPQQ